MTDAVALRRILSGAANAAGVQLSDRISEAVATVAVNANLAIESIDAPPGLDYLTAVKKQQRAVQSTTASEVLEAAVGTLPADELVSRNSIGNLAARAAAASAGDIFPVAILIDQVAAAEPAAGAVDFEFSVTLTAPSNLPVSVDFETRGGTATAADGDFTPVSGTIMFAPGETEMTVHVPVLADGVDELGETFHVQLSNPHHALLASQRGVGTIRMPADAQVLPSEFELGGPLSVFVDAPVEIGVGLPGIVEGTVEWGDGTVDPVTLTDKQDRVFVTAVHQYATTGAFEVVLTMTHSSGQTVVARRSVSVNDVLTIPDAEDPQREILLLNGSAGKDTIRILWNEADETVTATVNGADLGTYAAEGLSRIVISAGAKKDQILSDPGVPVDLEIDAGAGSDFVVAGAGNDVIVGGEGNDVVFGGAGDDEIFGEEGNDKLYGDAGNDTLSGGEDNDKL